jgi:hypothetical protein
VAGDRGTRAGVAVSHLHLEPAAHHLPG